MHALEESAVEVPTQEARKAFLSYREAVHDGRHSTRQQEAEDRMMMRAYREAAKGKRIIRLSQTLAAGGTELFEFDVVAWRNGRQVMVPHVVRVPKLAVGRADRAFVWTNGVDVDGSLRLQTRRTPHNSNRRDVTTFAPGTFDADTEHPNDGSAWSRPRIRSLLPPIPPHLRPKRAGLHNFHILWEAEWEVDRTTPPGDPALLRHLAGDLYAVLAVWDLTPLEQAVLGHREPSELD